MSGEREHAASFVISEDLPKTPQTETLTKFLNEIESTAAEDALTALCDIPAYCTIIDQSGWPVGRPLCMKTKNNFITYLLVEELLGKECSYCKTSGKVWIILGR